MLRFDLGAKRAVGTSAERSHGIGFTQLVARRSCHVSPRGDRDSPNAKDDAKGRQLDANGIPIMTTRTLGPMATPIAHLPQNQSNAEPPKGTSNQPRHVSLFSANSTHRVIIEGGITHPLAEMGRRNRRPRSSPRK
jgi:hypothetical protein